ncbi:hypothetical protein, partial [Caldibacillus debilis]
MTAPAQNIRENRRLRAVFPCCRQKGFVMGDSGKMAYRAVFPFFVRPAWVRRYRVKVPNGGWRAP